ncbi:MAG TPA: NUDIX hydrolase [Pseudomonadales bacterium]|nr:NUDIX hydrolase [Pseudomonadales bacterium]
MKPEIKPWEKKSTRQVADCRIFTVNELTSVSPLTKEEHNFYSIETGDWVNIAPITSANELVCIRQYRHGSGEITIEIPGGMVDLGEDPAKAAARECLEETGFECDELIPLGDLAPNPALFPNRLHTFLAPNARRVGEISNTSTEQTEVQLIPMEQLPEFLVSGEIDHALVVATLWRLLYFLKD